MHPSHGKLALDRILLLELDSKCHHYLMAACCNTSRERPSLLPRITGPGTNWTCPVVAESLILVFHLYAVWWCMPSLWFCMDISCHRIGSSHPIKTLSPSKHSPFHLFLLLSKCDVMVRRVVGGSGLGVCMQGIQYSVHCNPSLYNRKLFYHGDGFWGSAKYKSNLSHKLELFIMQISQFGDV